jgi:hypothetical protein
MNDLDLMAGFRADAPPPDPAALDAGRDRLMSEAAGRGRSRSRIRLWHLAPVTVTVAAVVIGASLLLRPAGQGAPSSAEATAVLRLAAAGARSEPALAARPDQFVYIHSVQGGATFGFDTVTGVETFTPPDDHERWVWTSVDGTRGAHMRQKSLAPGTAEPGANWEQAFPPCTGGRVTDCDSDVGYPRDLPTDAAAMRDHLYRGPHGNNPADRGAFTMIGDIMRSHYVSPAAAAAMFEAAATIPGVSLVPGAVDTAGRRGVAVSRLENGSRRELIFEEGTYRYLGEREVATAGHSSAPDGTVISYGLRLEVAIVDRTKQMP